MAIIARNFRLRFGEIDLVAREGDTLVFIEVKARMNGKFGPGRAAIDPRKRQRLTRLAEAYLCLHRQDDPAVRFDVVEIHGLEIRHWRDAFRGDG
jgi:putative endonuclease